MDYFGILPPEILYWLVNLRFSALVIALMAGFWAITDLVEWYKKDHISGTRLNISFHLCILSAALAILMTSPVNFLIVEHMFSTEIAQQTKGYFLLGAMGFVFAFFVLAQQTRLIYRGVRGKSLFVAGLAHTAGIVLLVGVGAYFNVYFR